MGKYMCILFTSSTSSDVRLCLSKTFQKRNQMLQYHLLSVHRIIRFSLFIFLVWLIIIADIVLELYFRVENSQYST